LGPGPDRGRIVTGVPSKPTLNSELREAVDRALKGDWQGAHGIVQDHEANAHANWIHAVVHRFEGDLDNARYWYGRCQRPYREDVPPEVELKEIRDALST
jgi:hypothetical protein